MVPQLYAEFGDFSSAMLVQRLEKTAVGAAVAAGVALHYVLNLIRDIPPAAAPDADTAALLDWAVRPCRLR
jgi:hypothetical protein